MTTALHIPLKDYVGTSFRPDREYVDGEARERNVGKYEHARVQALLAGWFGNREKEWGIAGAIAPRLQVSPNRIRVPDLVVLTAGPQPDVLTEPPFWSSRFSPQKTPTPTPRSARRTIAPWASRPSGSSIRRPARAACAPGRIGWSLPFLRSKEHPCTLSLPTSSAR